MNISNIFSTFDNRTQKSLSGETTNQTNSVSQTTQTSQTSQSNASADLSALKEGAVFKGEILDVAGDKVTIQLENEAKIPARLQGDISLGVGDQLLFSVKENNQSQVLIKPMFDSLYSAQTQVLERALDMSGLSPTEKNFSAAKELMEAGLPLDRQSITKVLSQSMKFPEADMKTLVTLNKMNIPVNAENIEQFGRYQEYEHQLMGDIKQVVSSMSDIPSLFPEGTNVNDMLSFVNEVVDDFVSNMPTDIAEDGNEPEQNHTQIDENVLQSSSEAIEGQTISDNAKEASDMVANENSLEGKESTIESEKQILQENDEVSKAVASNTVEEFSKTSGLSSKEANTFIQNLQSLGVSPEVITNVVKNSNSPEQLLQNLLNNISNLPTDSAKLQQLLESKEFKSLFSDMIHKSWSLNPKMMSDPKEIDDLYERIQKQTKHFEEALSSKGGDAKGFSENSQNMRQNMSFMEQLNHNMIYAQMPLKLSNQNANSELFVYADKRKLMEKKDGISVMLHLDMDHLGQTDIKVTLTGSNVHARFYLNDQESVEIITDNMNDLAKQLGLRGFSLTDEVVKREPVDSINQVVDEIIDENAERSIKRYTFDARM